ncbi:ROK family transcriptional regulator [Paenibacillus sp. SAF-068]|uniref:ROK family transcriptional regulator n=1 Tax=Paenibacillus sp. SAF-068 TaxID=3436864 RepID=UPI003F809F04
MAGTPQYIRNLNENLIMDALITQGTMSRADISRQTGLSKPTVSLAVEHLIDRNLVKEMGRADNAQGRKATLIRFNETAYYVCGIDIGATRIRIALSDLNGEIIDYRTYPMVVQEGHERAETTMLLLLRSHMNELLDEHHLNWEQIQCIGFGIPGVVLPDSGRINRIVDPLAGLEQAFSLESLSGAFPCEVILENDVNLAALGEYRSGAAAGYPLFVFFSIGTGTGAGIMVHGQLLRGLGGLTGEIAEMLVEDGRRLEDVLSADGLMKLAKHYLDQHDELLDADDDAGAVVDINEDVVADDPHRYLTPEKLFEAARSGEVEALDILQQYSQMIASALRQISVVLAPDLIVLGGGVGGNGDVLLPLLRQIISEQFPVQPQLICSKLGEQAVVTGAVQVAIQQTMLNLQQEAME